MVAPPGKLNNVFLVGFIGRWHEGNFWGEGNVPYLD